MSPEARAMIATEPRWTFADWTDAIVAIGAVVGLICLWMGWL